MCDVHDVCVCNELLAYTGLTEEGLRAREMLHKIVICSPYLESLYLHRVGGTHILCRTHAVSLLVSLHLPRCGCV